MNARYYLSGIGRFVSADTIVPDPTDPQSFNRYSYGLNNPVKYIDPSGHCAIMVTGEGEFCMTTTDDGADIVGLGGSVFLNEVEVAFANFFLTGDVHYLADIDNIVDQEYQYGLVLSLDHVARQIYGNGEGENLGLAVADPLLGYMVGRAVGEPIAAAAVSWISSLSGKFLWSSTPTRTSVQNAIKHWKDHRGEFPELNNAREYVEATHSFVNDPPRTALTGTRSNGERVFYDPVSDVFAVSLSDGTPKTMFVPDPAIHGYSSNLEYFYANLAH